MPATALDRDLQAFAVELFERSGGVADWPEVEGRGTAVLPRAATKVAQLPSDEVALGLSGEPGVVHVSLAGEFLETASRLLQSVVPRDGSFCIGERYLTSGDLTAKIAQSFSWQNARAKFRSAEPALVSYHLWTVHGWLKSEDVWEGLFRFAINEASAAVVELPDVFQEPDFRPADAADAADAGQPSTYEVAIAEGRRQLMSASADFVKRIEQRLERDRKRLHDYYRALAREAGGSKRRTGSAPSAEDVAARRRAVDLELRRKLSELNEQYALRATLRPAAVARVRLPALVICVTIQRKQAVRDYRLCWNSLLKKLEPLPCSRCRSATFAAIFTDETVDLLCKACAQAG